jgi:hypothetical protein
LGVALLRLRPRKILVSLGDSILLRLFRGILLYSGIHVWDSEHLSYRVVLPTWIWFSDPVHLLVCLSHDWPIGTAWLLLTCRHCVGIAVGSSESDCVVSSNIFVAINTDTDSVTFCIRDDLSLSELNLIISIDAVTNVQSFSLFFFFSLFLFFHFIDFHEIFLVVVFFFFFFNLHRFCETDVVDFFFISPDFFGCSIAFRDKDVAAIFLPLSTRWMRDTAH